MESRSREKGSQTLTEMQKARLDRLAERIKELPPGRIETLMDDIQQTFTVAEAAKLLNCHKETIRRAIRKGELQAGRIGHDYRISKIDLVAFWKRKGGAGELFG